MSRDSSHSVGQSVGASIYNHGAMHGEGTAGRYNSYMAKRRLETSTAVRRVFVEDDAEPCSVNNPRSCALTQV